MRRRTAWFAVVAAGAMSGCGGSSPSMLEGRSAEARRISGLWWLVFGLGATVYVVVVALVVVAVVSRGRTGADGGRVDHRFLLFGGLIGPALVLGVVAVQTVRVSNAMPTGSAAVHVEVLAERWWWRVDYPADGVTTANEIHVPLGVAVDISLRSTNVVHSLWVPELNGKSDVVPGQTNHMRFTADTLGTFRGQCAEFCGIGHARMAFLVVVQSEPDFDGWLAANRQPAAAPAPGLATQGAELVATTSCAGCHTVKGTAAIGVVGPDLSHVGSRQTLAADTLANTDDGMRRWLAATQTVKPGALMPQIDLSAAQIDALVAYLESLK